MSINGNELIDLCIKAYEGKKKKKKKKGGTCRIASLI
jgi:hypothetical protein